MYKKLVFPAFCLLLATACQTNTNTGSNTPPATTDTTEAATDAADLIPSGDLGYELKVVDDQLVSPRIELSGEIAGVPLKINYGSPAVKGRTIFGDLIPYEQVWRTGANEATRITFSNDVMVGTEGQKLAAGTYSLFTLPAAKDKWTVIFNTVADQWGAYDYDQAADALRVSGSSMPAPEKAERMHFAIDDSSIKISWDDLIITFPVTAASK